ncbi:iron chelate uptake ABC transporter family permease subunit [Brachybacterium sp. EF45031]|uniref:iron chelate uptake ABC transporter family permease subunit n=1 Tax=Brachybacterium sillae TaxID=2810536 RepID=UPI00217D3D0C|nr:iron chelate uptake ABC transporter family permease subunit [Brachybacterium sillae]MCS6711934.1 iron chelate uptake ABC transporter family permease subunit [Brachybacterium sillae]
MVERPDPARLLPITPRQGNGLPGQVCTARLLGQCTDDCGVRCTRAFDAPRQQHRYWVHLGVLAAVAVVATFALLSYDNPMPWGSEGYWLIARLRLSTIAVMAVVAVCQALATVAFQTVADNRILTPSILGFESLYIAIQTATMFVAGAAGLAASQGLGALFLRIGLMVALASALYGWLLSGRRADMHTMLLIGMVIGGGLGALSTFLQRLLTPSEFDILTARLFGNLGNADPRHLVAVAPVVAVTAVLLWLRSPVLNVLALGRDTAVNLGVPHRAEMRLTLVMVAVLMAVSTALVGPMTFLGFLVAMLTYQLVPSRDHRYLLPAAALVGYVVLAGATLIMRHVFYAAGAVTVIIELVGASVFLVVLLRKGRL